MPPQECGQRLLLGVCLIEIGGHVGQKQFGRFEQAGIDISIPLCDFGKIEQGQQLQQIRLHFALLNCFAPQSRAAVPRTSGAAR